MSQNDTTPPNSAPRRKTGAANDDAPRLAIQPIDTSFSFKNKAYAALKNVIIQMDIYRSRNDIRLDESAVSLLDPLVATATCSRARSS